MYRNKLRNALDIYTIKNYLEQIQSLKQLLNYE